MPTARTNLNTIYYEDDEDSASSKSTSSETLNSQDSTSVYLRVRPTANASYYLIENKVFKILNSNRTIEKSFTFSDVFGEHVMQREVYTSSVEGLIDNEENLTLLMYGTSGSGKTYTLMGDCDQPGVIPRYFILCFKFYAYMN